MKKSKYSKIIVLTLVCISAILVYVFARPTDNNKQTDVQNAEFSLNDKGVPVMNIEGIGDVMHPAWIGIYALQYAGQESFYNKEVEKDQEKFKNCIDWFKENAKTNENGLTVWEYRFDSTYNDVSIEAPWYSTFGQALAIEALVEYYNQEKDNDALALAQKGAEALFTDINDGGLLFEEGEDVWFEEIPSMDNPSHILNGHMRGLIALQKLYQATNDKKYDDWYQKGISSLEKWLPKYDTGYWLRYDLNPKKDELLFRFNNKYGYSLTDLPIDEIKLTDPITGKSVSIDVGSSNDVKEGEPRIAGNDWQQIEDLDGRSVRRLSSVTPESSSKQMDGEMYAPYTYFYLNLPSEWKDNLRSDWFEMTVVYKDEKAGNMNVQMRSIAPGNSFVDLKDGDLLLSGSGDWREWKIPVRTTDLGWWTGELYAEKHLKYLDWFCQYSPELNQWKNVMQGYLNSSKTAENPEIVENEKIELPEQWTMIPIYSLDEKNVINNHFNTSETVCINGNWLAPSIASKPVISPYLVAQQAIKGNEMLNSQYDLFDIREIENTNEYWRNYDWIYPDTLDRIKKEPAYKWLRENAIKVGDGLAWTFNFDNSYNDLVQQPGWQSAFSQRYVIDAFMAINDKETSLKAAYAYEYTTEDGGLCSYDKSGDIWYEEVPNNSHILNADLASIVALDKVYKTYNDERVKKIKDKGIESLLNNINRFDTGYWTKYDMNPKKEMLLQIDWLDGEKSPLIDEIQLYNPISNTATQVDVGTNDDFTAYPNIAGSDWSGSENVDGKSVRGFVNGYSIREEAVEGGAQHNVYINAVLPEREFDDYFNLPTHQLIIKYKDVAEGQFSIKPQNINEGNYLKFVDIPNGIINCVGDNQWKTAVINIRPQDTGWYMGADYQVYHNEQLGLIADATNNWLLKQYHEKWEYYLNSYNNQKDVIINSSKNNKAIVKDISVISSSDTYKGFELENSLDSDPNDDYTAFVEGVEGQYFELGFKEPADLTELNLIFESENNFLKSYEVKFYLNNEEVFNQLVENQSTSQQTVQFDTVKADKVKITAKEFVGQDRIILRQFIAYKR